MKNNPSKSRNTQGLNDRGIASLVIIVLVVVGVLVLGGGGYYIAKKFGVLSIFLDETANWKTYTNTKYGFSLKYPNDLKIEIVEEGSKVGPGLSVKIYDANYKAPAGAVGQDIRIGQRNVTISIDEKSDEGLNSRKKSIALGEPEDKTDLWSEKVITVDGKPVKFYKLWSGLVGTNYESYFSNDGYIFNAISFQGDLLEKILSTFKFISSPSSTIDTSDWKTYTNTKYGFEFKYSPEWKPRFSTNKFILNLGSGTETSTPEDANGIYLIECGLCSVTVGISDVASIDQWINKLKGPQELSYISKEKRIKIDGMDAFDWIGAFEGMVRRSVVVVRQIPNTSKIYKYTISMDYDSKDAETLPAAITKFELLLSTFKFTQ